ncbi:MAG: PHP domain-containing protein [Lentisphaeria bacterium]
MATSRYPCDLHAHSTRSDGNDTPRELIDNAAAAGVVVLGLTDHDTLPPETVEVDGVAVPTVAYAHQRGVRLLPGDEFSCDTWVDDVHICGYLLDWRHPALAAEVAAAERSKSRAYEELCERLTARGMPLDWERDLLSYVKPDGTPARRNPDDVQRKHVFEAMAAKGYTPSWSEAKILVQGDPELNVRRRKIDPLAAIRLIHECGGIAILAHPYLIEETVHPEGGVPVTRAAYIDRLIAAGLDGIEASYSYDKTSYKGTQTPEEVEAEVRRLYAARVRIISGGSDYHADHKKGAKKCRALGERGLTLAEFQAAFGASSS